MGGKGAETFSKQPKASSEQVRMVKMTQNVKGDAGPEERRRMKLVKKIVEATQCSLADAEIALFDADNNVDSAVIAIIEKAEEESMWTENKSRKTRKDEKVENVASVGRGFRSGGRNGATNGERRGRGAPRGDGERPTIDSTGDEGAANTNDRGVRRGRGIRGGGRGSGRDYAFGDRTRKQDNPENAASEENASFGKSVQGEHDEFNWHKRNKDKPLVFTRSDQSSQSKDVDSHVATTSQIDTDKSVLDVDKSIVAEPKPFTGCAAGPISFAAAAAGRKLVVEQKVVSNTDASAVKTATENEATNDSVTSPAVYQSALLSSSNEATQEEGEPTLVDESKNVFASQSKLAELSLQDSKDIAEEPFADGEGYNADVVYERSGETAHDSTDVPTEVSEPAVEKEVSIEPKSQHFEIFNADTISVVGNGSTANKDETFDTSAKIQQRSSSSTMDFTTNAAHATDASGDKVYVNRQLNQQLSYGDTKNLSFPPEAYVQQQQTRQQQPSQQVVQPQGQPQSQHPMYPPQVPYGNFSYMNPMYNPMGNMRNEDQYNAAAAAFMHNYQSLMGFDMNALAAAAMNTTPGTAPQQQQQQLQQQQQQQQQRPDNVYDHKSYHSSSAATGTSTNIPQQRSDTTSTILPNSAVPPPPGFSGPPSNMGHYMQPTQQNIASLFAMPPQYPAQLPFSFLMPNVSGNSQQHKVPSHLPSFHQDDGSSDLRLSGQQQKSYGQQSQMDKYGSNAQKVDRMGPGAQSTPPPQMGYGQPYGNYMSQMHGSKKNYNNHHNWNS